jgi:hypothetical protein
VSEYEGLNLPQLLERMHDVIEPPPVAWLPQTDGWWVLLGWALLLTAAGGLKIVQHRRRNRYRRDALAELDGIVSTAGPEGAAAIAGLVKRTALTAFPRTRVASLYGDSWAGFLSTTGRNDPVIDAAAPVIARAAYAPDVEMDDIVPGAARWIRRHRV